MVSRTTKCPEPLRALKGYLSRRGCLLHVSGRYPAVIATTGSCASPTPSHHLWSKPRSAGLCRLLSAPAGCSTFPALPPRILPQMPGPLPRRSLWCAYSFLPTGRRPSPIPNWVGTPQCPVQRRQYGGWYRGCSHSLMFRPPGLLATQVVPTAA